MKKLLLFFFFTCWLSGACFAQRPISQHDERAIDSLAILVKEPFFKGGSHFNALLNRLTQASRQAQRTDLLLNLNLINSELKLHTADTAGAIRHLDEAEDYIEEVSDPATAALSKANMGALYIRAGIKNKGIDYVRQSTLGTRDKVVFTDTWFAAVQARSQAYVLLKDNNKLLTGYNDALKVAERYGKQPIYKVRTAFAENFAASGNIKKSFEILDALASDMGFTPEQTKLLYSRLIIYSIKAGRYTHLNEYYTRLMRLPNATADRAAITESLLAKAMYKDHTKKLLPAMQYYRRLIADYRQHGASQINMEGMIRLASLYHKNNISDSAAYYFKLLGAEIKGGLLQTATGKLYLQVLAQYKSGTNSVVAPSLLQDDSAYKSDIYSATKELEYQYQVIKQKQDNTLLKQQKQLEELKHAKKRQQYLLFILVLSLLFVIAAALMLFLIWRRKQALKEHAAEKLKMEQEHRAHTIKVLTRAQEEERSQIAEVLHNEVGAMLAVARLNLSATDEDSETVQVSGNQVKVAAGILAKLTHTIRDMSHQLMPLGLKQMGLRAAVEEMVKEINNARIVKIETLFINLDNDEPLAEDMQVNIYRMVQELFQNMLKHSIASKAFLQIVRHHDSLNIIFEDNGKGMDTAGYDIGAGLAMMRKRAEYYGGTLTIEPRQGGGSLFVIDLLLPHA